MLERRRLQCGLALLFLACASGCVAETIKDETHTFAYSLWVPVVAFVIGAVAVVGGFAVRPKNRKLCWVLVIVGLVVSGVAAPTLYAEKGTVGPMGFSLRTGFPGLQSMREVGFANVRSIEHTTERRRRRKRRRTYHYLVCTMKNGQTRKISVSGNIGKAMIEPIFEKAARLGIVTKDAS